MISYFPVVTGSLTVSGSVNISGGITALGGISISGSIDSASYASTASFVALAQSASNAVSAQTASFANTLTVAGNLTAQTLVVQTITSSVDFVTGSTRFGSLAANTHVFTGSVLMSGSVGIGINPEFKLDVNGDIALPRTQKLMFAGPTVGDRSRSYITGDGNNNIFLYGPSSNLIMTWGYTGDVRIGNGSSNSYLQLKTGGSTNYSGLIYTDSNVDILNINGGSASNYDSGASIGLMGADRYGTKTAGALTLAAGNAVNNTAFGYISMNTANTERVKISYSGNTTMNYTSSLSSLNNPTLFVGSLSGVAIPFQVVADSGGRILRFMNPDFNNNSVGTDLRFNFGAGSGNTHASIQVYTSGETAAGNLVLQQSYGNVAIGTSNPFNHKLWVQGNVRMASTGLMRTYYAQQIGTGGTFDIFRFLDDSGAVIAASGISGILFLNAQDTATGGNQISYTFHLQTNGNGTAQANITQMSYQLRGNQPLQSISLANDGGGGAVKVTGSVPGGVSGCNVWATFIGTAI
jgi:hypothetical protein